MTRRHELMLEDLTSCTHEPETPVLAENGTDIDHWVCRCGRRAATGQIEEAIMKDLAVWRTANLRAGLSVALGVPAGTPRTPYVRVSTTAWRVAAPGERLTHEFHLALPCRPVHVGLIGAALLDVRMVPEGAEAVETPAFHESSVEETDRGIRIDHDLETPEGLRENLVVFVDFECTLKAKGSVTILLIFETAGQTTTR